MLKSSRRLLWYSLTIALLSACSGGGSDDNPTPTGNSSCIAPDFAAPPAGEIALMPAFPDLPQLSRLVGLYQAPDDGSQWYALSQHGIVYRFANQSNSASLERFLDLEQATYSESYEAGMLGLAFHPAYAENGLVYIYYMPTIDSARLSRFNLDRRSDQLDPASEQILLELEQPAANHNGGGLAFGADGFLYLSLGDGGGGGDRFNNGQNPNTLLGAVLRLDVNVQSDARAYGIPADNPFADGVNGRPEIYAYGLRNPWRWSFDRVTGELWLGDVGQGNFEEIDIIVKGGNYGWPIMEGNRCYNSNQCDQTGLELPVQDYSQDATAGCSVTGGYVYRGDDPGLVGTYIFGDYCNGNIYGIDPVDTSTRLDLLETSLSLSAFAEDQNGELFALNLNGAAGAGIFRLAPVSESESESGDSLVPNTLSASGCFSDLPSRQLAPDVVAYQVNSPFWSDGANKERAFAIPAGTRIRFNAAGEFNFPDRSVLIKHFYYQDEILETRLMMKHLTGWTGYSYQWNQDKTDATLLESGKSVAIDSSYTHVFPGRDDCMTCHTSAAGFSLAAETLQLNNGMQLQALQGQAYLEGELPAVLIDQRLYGPDDEAANLEQKARSYLHSNCAYCHRPGGPIAGMDLRYTTALSATGTCNVEPQYGDLDALESRLIMPGDSDRSVVALRMAERGSDGMPPLASNQVDEKGLTAVAAWINDLASCD